MLIAYPDTSFLCAMHVRQTNSETAAAYFQKMPEPLHVSGLLLYEFRQSVRFQAWLYSQNRGKGYSESVAEAALGKLDYNLSIGALIVVNAEWSEVHRLAENISRRHTTLSGHRSLDILHVATALHLGAREFLTFDANQRKLATAEKLQVKL
jgi:predicted nucleic acid-binding protein